MGLAFGAQGIAMAMLQAGLIGVLVRRMGELRLLLLGAALMAVGFGIAANADSSIGILAAFFCTITGGTVCTPVLNALVANRTPVHLRGRMLGTTSSSAAFGRVFGPLLAGATLSLFGFDVAWLTGAAVALLIVAWAVSQLKQAVVSAEPATAAGSSDGR